MQSVVCEEFWPVEVRCVEKGGVSQKGALISLYIVCASYLSEFGEKECRQDLGALLALIFLWRSHGLL